MFETVGASLGGGADSSTGGNMVVEADAALTGTSSNTMDAMRGVMGTATGGVGVGMARSVIFSLKLTGGSSLAGGGGGKLERATGMCSDNGASPPRTTTAWRGGGLSPGLAMKPPRGVIASRESS